MGIMDLDDKLVSERLRGRVEYWKQIAAIQIHFNDMCIRTRWLGLTAIATLVVSAIPSGIARRRKGRCNGQAMSTK
jgi:polyferredoxin